MRVRVVIDVNVLDEDVVIAEAHENFMELNGGVDRETPFTLVQAVAELVTWGDSRSPVDYGYEIVTNEHSHVIEEGGR